MAAKGSGQLTHGPATPRHAWARASGVTRRIAALGPQGRIVRRIATQSAGVFASQLVVIAGAPLLTRLYTPEHFGALAAYISIVAIGASVATLHYDVAVPLPAENDDAMNLLAVAVLTTIVVTLAALFVGFAVVQAIPLEGPWRSFRELWWVPPLGILAAALTQEGAFWCIRQHRDRSLAMARLAQSGGQLTGQSAFGLLHFGTAGLLVGDVLGRLTAAAVLVAEIWRHDRAHLRAVRWERMRAVALRYRRFPLLSGPSAILGSITAQLPTLLLAAFYGPVIAGLYYLSYRILGLPMGLVGEAIANVYYGELARLARLPGAPLLTVFRRTTIRLAAIGTPPIALLAILGPAVFGWAFGREWEGTGEIVRLLAPMLVLQFVSSPLGSTLDVLERQDLYLRLELIRVALIGGTVTLAHAADATASEALLALMIAASLGSLIYLATVRSAIRAHLRRVDGLPGGAVPGRDEAATGTLPGGPLEDEPWTR